MMTSAIPITVQDNGDGFREGLNPSCDLTNLFLNSVAHAFLTMKAVPSHLGAGIRGRQCRNQFFRQWLRHES
jgi:hypothetical protein